MKRIWKLLVLGMAVMFFAAIMCDRAPVPPPSPSQTLFCRYATDNRYDLV